MHQSKCMCVCLFVCLSTEADDSRGLPECAVCLQPCIHPVRLPCSHMFCYLCMKGVAGHSRRCALCRAEIPQDFVRRPVLVSPDKSNSQNDREPDADGGREKLFHVVSYQNNRVCAYSVVQFFNSKTCLWGLVTCLALGLWLVCTLTEVKARQPRLVLGWVTTREDRTLWHGFVRRRGLKSVTDRLYSRYSADTHVRWIKPNLGSLVILVALGAWLVVLGIIFVIDGVFKSILKYISPYKLGEQRKFNFCLGIYCYY